MMVPKLRAPVVFVHGLLGYDRFRIGSWTIVSYFSTIPDFLRQAENQVLVARLSPTAGVAERAAQLKAFLDREVPNEPVHLIAHSMGGLDSRYMISRLGMAARVLTLTTIATPHRGSAFADWGVRRLKRVLAPVFDLLEIPRQAFYDLTTERCRQFNEQVPDSSGVRYFSVAGQHQGDWRSPQWQLPHQIVLQAEGPNDGVVSVRSATYGESVEIWEGDHLSLVNCPNPLDYALGVWRDRRPQFGRLIQRLADEGF